MRKFSLLKSLFFFGFSMCLVLLCGLQLARPSFPSNLLQEKVNIAGTNINGTLILTQLDNQAVLIRGKIQGNPANLTPGLHGLHIHSVGV